MVDKIVGAIFILFLALVVYLLFIVLPVMLYNESQCLNRGYPNAKITGLTLDRYCVGLDGNTKSVVVKQ